MALDVRVAATVTGAPSPRTTAALAARVLRAERAKDAVLSVTFVGRRRMRSLNREWLGHDRVTDVIAFDFGAPVPRSPVIGDIYICSDVAAANARRLGTSLRQELRRLVIHGVLHVLGHDHPAGAGRARGPMWRLQEQYLSRFGRP